jgi:predicted phage-related endonuclease
MTWRQGAFVVVQCDDRDRWLAERRRAVGASEAGAVWGVSSYLSRLELHAAKRGVDVPRPDDDADWLADGQDLEEAIARIYARR